MSKKILFLTYGFTEQNTRSIFFPLVSCREFLKENGISIYFTSSLIINGSYDYIFIDSNLMSSKFDSEKLIVNYINKLGKIKKIYIDSSDSTTILHPQVLKCVNLYCKGQILKNKNGYKKKFYGNRIFTDTINKKKKVIDEIPIFSKPIINDFSLKKLGVHWNSSLCNYSFIGKISAILYEKTRIKSLLFFPKLNHRFDSKTLDIFARMNSSYSRNTISWQRRNILKKISKRTNTSKVSSLRYYHEIKKSKIVLSPFGWGEINYRDYEAFLNKCILMKPSMDHVITFPDLYKLSTYVKFSWTCDDFEDQLEKVLSDLSYFNEIAKDGYYNYLNFLQKKNLQKFILTRVNYMIESS